METRNEGTAFLRDKEKEGCLNLVGSILGEFEDFFFLSLNRIEKITKRIGSQSFLRW